MEKLFSIANFSKCPVVPIPPSFSKDGVLDIISTIKYLSFLKDGGFRLFMTTMGTSQFNLLSTDEIYLFNRTCAENIYPYPIILGIPPLANIFARNEIRKLFDLNNVSFMASYPDRYYNNNEIISYFFDLADCSTKPLLFHGMPIKSGIGGIDYFYNSILVNTISLHPNIIGMKEESPSFQIGLDLCLNIDTNNFITILAGRSQQRYLFMRKANPTTFLAGLGNIYPQLEIKFWQLLKIGELDKAIKITNLFERPLFDTFMSIGWHKSLREALNQKLGNFNNRLPFINISYKESKMIKNTLDIIDTRICNGIEI